MMSSAENGPRDSAQATSISQAVRLSRSSALEPERGRTGLDSDPGVRRREWRREGRVGREPVELAGQHGIGPRYRSEIAVCGFARAAEGVQLESSRANLDHDSLRQRRPGRGFPGAPRCLDGFHSGPRPACPSSMGAKIGSALEFAEPTSGRRARQSQMHALPLIPVVTNAARWTVAPLKPRIA
jgi:hypothetical protein